MQGAPPLASPRLNPRGTGKWGRTKRPAGGTAVLLAGLLCHCGSPAGGTMVLVAGRFFTLAVFLPPSPRPPSRRERGGDQGFFHARGFAPCIPATEPARHLQSLPSGCPEWGFAPCETGWRVAFRYPEGAWQLRRGSGEQCRQPRRGGTGGEELRRLRWSSPPGQDEQVPLGFSPRQNHCYL